jgi:hypothetical protein
LLGFFHLALHFLFELLFLSLKLFFFLLLLPCNIILHLF